MADIAAGGGSGAGAGATEAEPATVGRRRMLAAGGAIAVGAWTTPVILTLDRAAAQGSGSGFIAGAVGTCGNPPDGFDIFDITATPTVPGSAVTTTSFQVGEYLLGPLPPGTYDLTFAPQGNPSIDTFLGVVVVDGATTTQDLDYTAGGC